jgi:hypothetical protein
MSRRFAILLERASRIRQMIEREQRLPKPSALRLMRMKQLHLQLSNDLRELAAKRLIAIASAPRLRPELVFTTVNSPPMMSHRL